MCYILSQKRNNVEKQMYNMTILSQSDYAVGQICHTVFLW